MRIPIATSVKSRGWAPECLRRQRGERRLVPDKGSLAVDKLSPISAGIAVAATLAVLNTLCAIAVAIWPDGVLAFFNSFAHGLDLNPIKSAQPLSLFRFFCGLIGLGLVGFIAGAIFAWTYNLVARE